MVNPQLVPPAVDISRERCPEIDPRIERTLKAPFPAPPPSRQLANGKRGLDDDDKRVWIDRAEGLDQRKTAAGSTVIDQYRRCRESEPSAAAAATLVAVR